ncbi:hypothetical protein [Streptomyces colonosanans]|uniref:Uncharacterized protein n=1 Tax=Streptomyces colonosanans TaxID=1428652 RepID=A0A1S2NV44_9ACTN|nr:hypothetical protein [Streptomyces colonosanans]OIJ85423.1 hypothetical protein BIV24_28555 [Streptomyces colonosanans]
MRQTVRVLWGPREESPEALTGHWMRTLGGLSTLLPAVGPDTGESWTWRWFRESGPTTDLRADEASVLAALRAQQAADGWSDRTGVGLTLVIERKPDWKIEIMGSAGGTSEFVYQSLGIEISAPDGTQLPSAELLALLAETWAPDVGDVTDDDVLDALEDETDIGMGEPSVGRLGYLSPNRAALVPDDLAVARKELPGGGVLLDVASPSDGVGAVVRANVRLRDAGALEPLPTPMDRSTL